MISVLPAGMPASFASSELLFPPLNMKSTNAIIAHATAKSGLKDTKCRNVIKNCIIRLGFIEFSKNVITSLYGAFGQVFMKLPKIKYPNTFLKGIFDKYSINTSFYKILFQIMSL